MAKRGQNACFFNKLRVYATANKWKSDQKGIFFRFMLSESSLQEGGVLNLKNIPFVGNEIFRGAKLRGRTKWA